MRAIVMREFGPPEVLAPEDVPAPEPGPGQALIAVDLANVTFVETQVRAGRAPNPAMAPALPAIPGNGVGGRVEAVGPGVEPGLVGRRVVTSTGGSGAYAERVAVAAGSLLDVPDGLSLRDAVALLADGRTALGLVRQADPQAGETVLVEAAAGGVGSLLVQLAAAAGARVVALAGGPDKLALARRLGADVGDRLPRSGVARGGARRDAGRRRRRLRRRRRRRRPRRLRARAARAAASSPSASRAAPSPASTMPRRRRAASCGPRASAARRRTCWS